MPGTTSEASRGRSTCPCSPSTFSAGAIEAVIHAVEEIRVAYVDTVVAGGAESMSNYPLMMSPTLTDAFAASARGRSPMAQLAPFLALKPSALKPRIAIVEGLTDPVSGLNMGQTAEVLAREWGITREAQDRYALESHRRTIAAWDEGRMQDEVRPYFPPPSFEPVAIDVGPRREQTMEQLAKLKPFFDRRHGTERAAGAAPVGLREERQDVRLPEDRRSLRAARREGHRQYGEPGRGHRRQRG